MKKAPVITFIIVTSLAGLLFYQFDRVSNLKTDTASQTRNSLTLETNNSNLAYAAKNTQVKTGKAVIYQVLPRIFGNKKHTNKAWGTRSENGVGKFSDFTETALKAIKKLGTTHIWFTGVLHHAMVADYKSVGISDDDPDVVKGRAGSPYAIKDYYNVAPDLADNPAHRLQEFKQLIERTHQQGMKVIIDIVPNHVARQYQSISKPADVEDFGQSDNSAVEYRRDNNFYYIPGASFQVPSDGHYRPLNGEAHTLSDGLFEESPAKWTGNNVRLAKPNLSDWYETVKLNYGVKANGDLDFERLPKNYSSKNYQQHVDFWMDKNVPNTWIKMREITNYWLQQGVDGFRYDMAEMVPVEFWSYLNSNIKLKRPDALLIAEIYNPNIYRDYIDLGKMDLLYDKVGFYDGLKAVIQKRQPTSSLINLVNKHRNFDQHLLHFLENHDEQRIASQAFAGSAEKAKPAMVVSVLVNRAANLIYFAQDLGEAALKDAGFGKASRTTLFDYWGLETLQRWSNGGKYDGAMLTVQEKNLQWFYQSLLQLSRSASALRGDYMELHSFNLNQKGYSDELFSFARWNEQQKLIVVSNFSEKNRVQFKLQLTPDLIQQWQLNSGQYQLSEKLTNSEYNSKLIVSMNEASISIRLEPLQSMVLELNKR
ncbi:MAG: alpha-amylase family protein [Enterobacterales bacterium]|nr:alpha-amylase family protein [Enterobacterales bacterium]